LLLFFLAFTFLAAVILLPIAFAGVDAADREPQGIFTEKAMDALDAVVEDGTRAFAVFRARR